MRIIFKIAKAELRNLFYSPVAWVIFVAFLILAGIQFSDLLVNVASQQQFYQDNSKDWKGFDKPLSMLLYDGAYSYLLENLFLFIPLLTMGVISREIQGGTIRLLGSSPVRTRDIVLGKYLGLVIYNMVLLLPVAFLMIAGYFSIVQAEYKIFLSALLGIFLLSCTYSAIGLYVSSLTTYQVVAALCTFLLFIVLANMSMFWQQHDFFRDLSWFLNIAGRVDSFLGGLITTNNLAYFFLIIFLFTGFTFLRLHNRQESGKWYFFFARYAALLVVVLALGYISSKPRLIGYLDVTRGKVNTIHPTIEKVVKELGDEPLKVTFYSNLMHPTGGNGFPSARNAYLWGVWGKYQRFHPNIDFDFVYYYDLMDDDTMFRKTYPGKTLEEVAKKFMSLNGLPKSIFKKPAEIRKMINLQDEGLRSVMQLEYKGKKTFLRTFDDFKFWPDQDQVAGAISMLTRDSIPQLYFSTGHYERSPFKSGEREFSGQAMLKLSRGALLNLGAISDTLNLSNRNIPGKGIFVLADPKSALSPAEQEKITQYLNAGGDAVFYAEPGKQSMLNPVLRTIGVELEDGIIVKPNKDEMAHIVWPEITDTAKYMADEEVLWKFRYEKVPILLCFPGSASMRYEEANGFRIEPIFEIADTAGTWRERGLFVPDSAAPVFSPIEGDVKEKKYVTGIKMTRQINNREQRIIVTGESDFMSLIRGSGSAWKNAAYSWLLRNEYPFYFNYPAPVDQLLSVRRKTSERIRWVFVYLLPGIAIASGAILLIRRKRK
ncbi:ABC transporter permease subunit [Pseudoflavitalea rhizosphaerae]|uniref:ABC transporter permease subunit n=1 Tax=Pseudoflavitalea rhizosphaerae TaxID=1884793 RepID=UPI000F8CA973|nr:Gldg family protein [Pseudoflavitalea rhizosphaerae]